MINTTQSIVKAIFNEFGASKKKNNFNAKIAKNEIDSIFEAQRRERLTSVNKVYAKAGFSACNITSMMVQNQIARG